MKINLGKLSGLVVFAAAAGGLFFSGLSVLKNALPVFLALLMFLSFLKLEFKLKNFLRKQLIMYPIIMWLLVPPLIFLATSGIENEYFRLGIFLVAITPQAIGASVVGDVIKASKELIVSHTVLFNLLTAFAYTALLKLFFKDTSIEIPVLMIMLRVFLFIFLPLAISLFFRQFKSIANAVNKRSKPITLILLAVIISTAVSSAVYGVEDRPSFKEFLPTAAIIFAMAFILYAAGFLLSRNMKIKKTMAVTLGYKNCALAAWVGMSLDPRVALPAVTYIIAHHTCNGLLMLFFSPNEEDEGAKDSG